MRPGLDVKKPAHVRPFGRGSSGGRERSTAPPLSLTANAVKDADGRTLTPAYKGG
jgi:hypothetical protein